MWEERLLRGAVSWSTVPVAHSVSRRQGLLCQCVGGTSSWEVAWKALAPQKSAWPPASASWEPWGCSDGLGDSALEAAVRDQLQRQACPLSSSRNPVSAPRAAPSGESSPSVSPTPGQAARRPCPGRASVCPRSQAPARLAKCWVMGSRCWRRTRSSLDASETPPAQASQGRRPNPTV